MLLTDSRSNNSDYPSCMRHIFADSTYFGYTLVGCGRTSGSDLVYFQSTTSSTSSSSSTSTTTTSSTSAATTTPPAATTSTAPADSGSSTPIGPIVGGVVGGVAALGLIGLGIFFIVRKSGRQSPTPPPPPTTAPAAPGGYGSPPQMAQGYPPSQGFVPPAEADSRASMVKPSYGTTMSSYDPQAMSVQNISPPHSPPTQDPRFQWYGNTLSQQEVPLVAAGYPHAGQPSPPPGSQHAFSQNGMDYQSGPVPATYAELDVNRPDRELRELSG